MDGQWLSAEQQTAWRRLAAVLELLPNVLDSQLRRDAGVTHFDYYVMAMLSEAPGGTLRMTSLAKLTSSTLPRLSHVVRRLEGRGLLERFPCPQDARATNVRLTRPGRAKMRRTAPGHVATVRQHVIDALTPDQVDQLTEITGAVLHRLDPEGSMSALTMTNQRRT